jgi:hypothetical protein
MSDSAPIPGNSPDRSDASQPAKSGLLADPVVRVMVFVSLGLVILFLATVVSVIATGVVAQKGPRSAAERQLITASAALEAGAKGDARADYVNALIGSGDLPAARVAITQARASVAGTTAPLPALDLSEARLLSVDGQWVNAVNLAESSMAGYKAKSDARVAAGGEAGKAAKAAGYGEGYYNAALVKAHALTQIQRWKDAVGMYDIYLRVFPTASDIFIDRGNAKAALNDKAGAEKDFRSALKFVPYDEEAKAGLKKIGVAQ